MNNCDVEQELDSCRTELEQIRTIISGLGLSSNVVPYLNKYSIIRACGCIETAFKALIADYCEHRSKRQVKRFISRRVRDGSANPSYDKLCQFLQDFDVDWKKEFKSKIDAASNKSVLLTSLQSLVDARNDFSHGGNPTASISDVVDYFDHSREIIEIMDDVVS